MSKPIVAIIGKPNVGKSTFFNYLAGSRISIVEDTPGVTRDRIYADTNWRGRNFTLIDTGGIEPESEDIILSQMREQANLAISMANVIVFVTDIRQGVTAADREIALMLKKSGKPIVLVCNKADNFEKDREEIYEFYNLGLGDPFPISASNALGIGDVLDEIYKDFPEKEDGEDDDTTIKVAIIGKPNVGKSSLINKLLGENRAIVSDIAGTTRDAIDTNLENEHGKYVFIDTAGIRRKSKVKESIEKFSIMRTLLAVERADVCLMMIDALEGVTDQDAKIAGEAHEAGKGIIIVVNKWDEYEKETGTLEKYKKEIYNKLSYLSYAPIIFISAKTGQRVNKLFDLINFVAEQNALRVSTSVLNQVINEAIAIVQPPTDKGKRLKIFYATQASTKPPTFVIFVNNKELFHFSYERYLVNNIRKEFGLEGTPVRVIVREKTEKGSGNAGTTNMLRSVGKKAAAITLICDILKGVVSIGIAILVGYLFNAQNKSILVQIAAIAVVIGHTFPIFFGFKGGKGVATSLGVLIMTNWQIGLICLAIAIIIMAITKMVSLGSCMAAIAFPLLTYFAANIFENAYIVKEGSSYFVYSIILAVIVLFNHRSNIKRIITGKENKLSFKKERTKE